MVWLYQGISKIMGVRKGHTANTIAEVEIQLHAFLIVAVEGASFS
jgi:hypothetical protein